MKTAHRRRANRPGKLTGGRAVSLTALGAVSVACAACIAGPSGTAPPAATPRDVSQARAATPPAPPAPKVRAFKPLSVSGDAYTEHFVALWNSLHNPANGYFSPQGIPYHSPETLVCEAPDYGHESTSETYSFWFWLEATYGRLTGDWSYLEDAWANAEAFIIPSAADQPTAASYDPSKPATYAPELESPAKYPARLDDAVRSGSDPLADELTRTYGNANVYGMHWLLDADNWYGFGRRADGTSAPSFINTFQRGPQESVWETIPQPSWDAMKWGGSHGYLDLFVEGSDAAQWKYTTAPDADARVVQAMYWASVWSKGSASEKAVAPLLEKAAKMGDYLRYALFDKYFKVLGCASPTCPAAEDRASAHYLLSWYYAWGGALPSSGGWAWRVGASASHIGYQNPMAALALSRVDGLKPRSKTAASDWATSLDRQLDLYRWLQSSEGALAGGTTNSWEGRYGAPPAGTPTFYGMAFDVSPVYRDPPSNEWFGFQVWSVERVAELYYVTGDERAKRILDSWVAWAMKNTTLTQDGGYAIPASMQWSGQPSLSWTSATRHPETASKTYNAGLHARITASTSDVGTAAGLVKVLAFYAAKARHAPAQNLARELLDRMWTKYRDAKGVSSPEERTDFKRFHDRVVVPEGWKGKMPNNDAIDASSTFLSIRSRYKHDADWPKVEAYLRGGPAPRFTYHRFWAQVEVATANATYAWLFQKKD